MLFFLLLLIIAGARADDACVRTALDRIDAETGEESE